MGDGENSAQNNRSDDDDSRERDRFLACRGEQPATHLWVNPVIKAIVFRDWNSGNPDTHCTLHALREWWKSNTPWPKQAASNTLDVLELGFDLSSRPKLLADNSRISYTGWCCEPTQVQFPKQGAPVQPQTGRGFSLLHVDWRTAEDLRPFLRGPAPHWILAVDTLDHLPDPRRLLGSIVRMYDAGREDEMAPPPVAHILVVTRNTFFFGTRYRHNGVELTLRSRREVRRLFRDAGLHVVDEASPPLPTLGPLKSELNPTQQDAVSQGIPPLHFWVVRVQASKTREVSKQHLDDWITELEQEAGVSPVPGNHSLRPQRNASALAILKAVKGKHTLLRWRELVPGQQLVTARNTGGRLFVVRKGRLVAYNPTKTKSDPSIRLTREVNEIAGEMEVFDQEGKTADRLYLLTLYASDSTGAGTLLGTRRPHGRPPKEVEAVEAKTESEPCEVLEVPASVVQDMVRSAEQLGNPFLRDLRSKTLEAELGLHNGSGTPQSLQSDWTFSGRWSVRPLKVADIRQVAFTLERAAETDRNWGLQEGPDGRFLFLSDFHGVRQMLSRKQNAGGNQGPNAAMQFLEACGVIRLLVTNSQLFSTVTQQEKTSPKHLRERPPLEIQRRVLMDHLTQVKPTIQEAIKKHRLDEVMAERYPKVKDGANKLCEAYLGKQTYTIAIVRSDYQLRRMATGLTNEVLYGFEFQRAMSERTSHRALLEHDLMLIGDVVGALTARAQAGLAHLDSMGVKVLS